MPKPGAVGWRDWAELHPLTSEVVPPQDDFVLEKPEVLHLQREPGLFVQLTGDELIGVLDAEAVAKAIYDSTPTWSYFLDRALRWDELSETGHAKSYSRARALFLLRASIPRYQGDQTT